MIGDENLGIGRHLGPAHQLLRIGEYLDMQTGRQFGPDAVCSIGGDVAEKQYFHLTVCAATKSSRTVIPSPGRSGISIMPSSTGNDSSIKSCSNGLAPSE